MYSEWVRVTGDELGGVHMIYRLTFEYQGVYFLISHYLAYLHPEERRHLAAGI